MKTLSKLFLWIFLLVMSGGLFAIGCNDMELIFKNSTGEKISIKTETPNKNLTPGRPETDNFDLGKGASESHIYSIRHLQHNDVFIFVYDHNNAELGRFQIRKTAVSFGVEQGRKIQSINPSSDKVTLSIQGDTNGDCKAISIGKATLDIRKR